MANQENTNLALDLWHLETIGLLEARRNGFTGTGQGVEVVVLDTRPQLSHPAFQNTDVTLYVCQRATTSSDLIYTLQRIAKDEFRSLTTQQSHPHGTGVLGLLCGEGIGVSPNVNVTFVCLEPKQSPTRTGWCGDIIEITHALRGLNQEFANTLINLSLEAQPKHQTGSTDSFDATLEFLCRRLEVFYGCLLFSSSGNMGANQQAIPAAFCGVISVGACDQNQRIPPKSGSGSYRGGSTYPFLIAPGEGVYSATTGGVHTPHKGTSFATPIAVGVAALFCEGTPVFNVQELRSHLEKACVLLHDVPKERQGHGLLRWPWPPQHSLAKTSKEVHTIQEKSSVPPTFAQKEGQMEKKKFITPVAPTTKICEDLAEELRQADPNALLQAVLLLDDTEDAQYFPPLSLNDFKTKKDYKRALFERGLFYVSQKVQPVLKKLENIPLHIFRGPELFGMIHVEGTAQALQQASTLPEVQRVALNAKLQIPTENASFPVPSTDRSTETAACLLDESDRLVRTTSTGHPTQIVPFTALSLQPTGEPSFPPLQEPRHATLMKAVYQRWGLPPLALAPNHQTKRAAFTTKNTDRDTLPNV